MEKLTFKKLFKPAKGDLGQFLLIYFYILFLLIFTNTIVGFEEKLKDNYIGFGVILLVVGYWIGVYREVIRNFFLKIKSKLTGKSDDLTEIN
jgi:hypothetical protein